MERTAGSSFGRSQPQADTHTDTERERERERERGERGEREAGVPVSKKQGDGSEARRGAGDSRSCLF